MEAELMINELRLNLRAPAVAIRMSPPLDKRQERAGDDLIPGCPQHLQSGEASIPQAPVRISGEPGAIR
jgi:hypothetical protein